MRKLFALLLAAVLFAGGFFSARIGALAQENQPPFPLEKMREFAEIFGQIKTTYVDEVSDEEMMENAIRGMLRGLDPHSDYFVAEQLNDFQQSLSGEVFGGLGIFVGEKNGLIEVITPIDDTPAARAGLQPGDLILKIDGTSTQKIGIEAAVGMMRGVVGSIVTLDIITPGNDNAPQLVELRRETIVAPSTMASLIEPDYGYLRINRFQVQTAQDTVNNLNRLYADNGRPLRGLILDLRNNPGGLLDASIGVASIFLPPQETAVVSRERQREEIFTTRASYHAGMKNTAEIKNVRLVVLVNNGSASAAEIVAGALQDHQRGVIIGSQTYGKASVQQLRRLRATGDKTAIKLTTARYYTPANRSIQAVGIKPDIKVFAAPSVETPATRFTLREADLAGHLENTQESEIEAAPETAAAAPFIPRDDYQYDQALVVLKALAVTGG